MAQRMPRSATAATIVWRGELADGDRVLLQKKVSQSRWIGRSAGRCHLVSGFAAIVNIERGALESTSRGRS
jgi:hypothetical protein